MQEEVQQKTITLTVNSAKLTAKELKQILSKFLKYEKNKHQTTKDVTPHDKQTIKELANQNQGMQSIEINNKTVGNFDRVARKYGIDYAIKKDKSVNPPKYLVFFKAKDTDALTAAFKDYTKVTVDKQKRKESVIEKLDNFKAKVKDTGERIKNKVLER